MSERRPIYTPPPCDANDHPMQSLLTLTAEQIAELRRKAPASLRDYPGTMLARTVSDAVLVDAEWLRRGWRKHVGGCTKLTALRIEIVFSLREHLKSLDEDSRFSLIDVAWAIRLYGDEVSGKVGGDKSAQWRRDHPTACKTFESFLGCYETLDRYVALALRHRATLRRRRSNNEAQNKAVALAKLKTGLIEQFERFPEPVRVQLIDRARAWMRANKYHHLASTTPSMRSTIWRDAILHVVASDQTLLATCIKLIRKAPGPGRCKKGNGAPKGQRSEPRP